MSAPLLSAQWYRVAALRPRLDAQLCVERVTYRGEVWYLLARADGSRNFRLNAAAYAFVGRCDGASTMQRLWDLMLAELKDDAPTQDELLLLLAKLHAAGLVGFDHKPDFGARHAADAEEATARSSRSLLAWRIPLGSPDRRLERIAPRCRWFFTPTALALWIAAVLLGGIAAIVEGRALAAHASTWLDSPRLLLLAWLAYPLVKALHELAHALAVKHWGGKVREWGITLMVFVPVPYVDASAASAFASARRRFVVSAAGIMVELLLAAVGLVFALNAQPGWLRDLGFVVFTIGTVSTVLVNGNPLLRFDGYHMLVDALELPNLALRSARHWIETLRQRVLGVALERGVVAARGERAWLWAYAPASYAYRLALSVAIVAWLGAVSFVLGLSIALYFAWMLAVKPLLGALRYLASAALPDAERRRALRRTAAAAVALALLGVLPLPFASVVQGVVWLPEQALVRAVTEGTIEAVHVADGAPVRAGDLLLSLGSPSLLAERVRVESRITALQTERFQSLRADAARAIAIERELDAASAELARLDERADRLDVRAQVDGTAVIAHASDLPGRFVERGTLLAHVLTGETTLVRVAVPHEQAALVHAHHAGVDVRLADSLGSSWQGVLLREPSGAAPRLPSAALGDRGGGSIVTDPRDRDGLTPAAAVVLADVRLPSVVPTRVGARAWVRFDHGHAPFVVQAARRAQQLFLRHFNTAQ